MMNRLKLPPKIPRRRKSPERAVVKVSPLFTDDEREKATK